MTGRQKEISNTLKGTWQVPSMFFSKSSLFVRFYPAARQKISTLLDSGRSPPASLAQLLPGSTALRLLDEVGIAQRWLRVVHKSALLDATRHQRSRSRVSAQRAVRRGELWAARRRWWKPCRKKGFGPKRKNNSFPGKRPKQCV